MTTNTTPQNTKNLDDPVSIVHLRTKLFGAGGWLAKAFRPLQKNYI